MTETACAFLDCEGAYYVGDRVHVDDVPVPLRPSPWHEWRVSEWVLSRDMVYGAAVDGINLWRAEQEQASIVFEHAGRRWDGGLRVMERIKPARRVAERAGTVLDGFFWTDADNNDVPVSLADLIALDEAHDAAIVAQGWRIHARQRAMKITIEAMDALQLGDFLPDW